MTPHQTSTKKHVIAGMQPTQEISSELNLWLEYAAYAASGASMYLIYEYVLAGLYSDPFIENQESNSTSSAVIEPGIEETTISSFRKLWKRFF